ncbi:DUF6124 family protein [Pseudomonas sp. B11(2017)]|uniref:DUF6124 family protein n=1 Tax=Pseudomonas sp. B11(2017) TaxID=1981748 RepID=UPI000A1F4720|nr:DUF6124 family protein [Pseudomonas sp. B11(2017)]
MSKVIPDPPYNITNPFAEDKRAEDLIKDRNASRRALDFYLNPEPANPRQPSEMFGVHPNIDSESLLVHACESLASAHVMSGNFANELNGPQRSTALAIQQIVMLAELSVNRALDRVKPNGLGIV